MIKFLIKSTTYALSIISVVFTFVPESVFGICKIFPSFSDETNIVLMRILSFIIVLILSMAIYALYLHKRKHIYIKGKNYSILIEYGDLLEMNDCRKVITFDECFTTKVGNFASDIKPTSICGQYLTKYPIPDIKRLIDDAQLKPAKTKSKYQGKERYESGKLVPNGEDLLMAFSQLAKDGKGMFRSYDEFLECLSLLWKEIDKYYGQKDVCISVLGSGLTRIGDTSFTQQELLDIIIESYKLSSHKIKLPYKLHIVCKERDDFSLNNIGQNI